MPDVKPWLFGDESSGKYAAVNDRQSQRDEPEKDITAHTTGKFTARKC
jgi:hypothetical protein